MPGRCCCFCSSLPATISAVPPRQTEEKKGAQSSASPITSISAVSSTQVSPRPPYASGTTTAGQPSSEPMRFQRSASQPSSLSMARRTSSGEE